MVHNKRMKRVVRKEISRRGQPVDLELFAAAEQLSHGTRYETADTIEDAKALVDFGTGDAEWQNDIFGAETEQDVDLYVRDDVAADSPGEIRGVDDAGTNGATELTVQGSTFRVVVAQSYSDYGAIIMGCERL